jgi:hypothetical protein
MKIILWKLKWVIIIRIIVKIIGKYHFINTCYFNFYTTKSKRSVRSLALGGHTLALTLTLDEIFTLGARAHANARRNFHARARHRVSKTRALHITGLKGKSNSMRQNYILLFFYKIQFWKIFRNKNEIIFCWPTGLSESEPQLIKRVHEYDTKIY